ncbi:MAG: hypothetical protein DMF02_08300 [Verrucomicrobia bacterium]|nr:MAG: hypothetical protein DMF02_08300 [Verrucomicrobiota bacterium]
MHEEERFQLAVKGFLMTRKFVGVAAISVFVLSPLRGQDAKFAADNLKYSRDFYSKVELASLIQVRSLSIRRTGTDSVRRWHLRAPAWKALAVLK